MCPAAPHRLINHAPRVIPSMQLTACRAEAPCSKRGGHARSWIEAPCSKLQGLFDPQGYYLF